ncbi:29465_t:CDS:2 [Gigaspora margarita]|uniref:29465_t:CDS:1 n=1 Tax=Gigaspora margarita TaxID=4874 RepID=A0ABM8W4N8_GIGMA|nr:29465_t:CDS:2 [Gigaspora margarita]
MLIVAMISFVNAFPVPVGTSSTNDSPESPIPCIEEDIQC